MSQIPDGDPEEPRGPQTSTRKLRWLLVIAIIAGAGLSGRAGYSYLFFVHAIYLNDDSVGQMTRDRFGDPELREAWGKSWHLDTGFLESEWSEGRMTIYDSGGRVTGQVDMVSPTPMGRSEEPWLWGMKDQEEPSAPWIEQRISSEEWIDRVGAALTEGEERRWRSGVGY